MIDSVNVDCALGRLVLLTSIVYHRGRGSGLVGARTSRIHIVVSSGGGGGFVIDCVAGPGLGLGPGAGPNFFNKQPSSFYCR